MGRKNIIGWFAGFESDPSGQLGREHYQGDVPDEQESTVPACLSHSQEFHISDLSEVLQIKCHFSLSDFVRT